MGKGTQHAACSSDPSCVVEKYPDCQSKSIPESCEVIFASKQQKGARDLSTVLLVAGVLVPFFTVLGPVVVALPFILAFTSMKSLGIYCKPFHQAAFLLFSSAWKHAL
jgi:hypothetical protein